MLNKRQREAIQNLNAKRSLRVDVYPNIMLSCPVRYVRNDILEQVATPLTRHERVKGRSRTSSFGSKNVVCFRVDSEREATIVLRIVTPVYSKLHCFLPDENGNVIRMSKEDPFVSACITRPCTL